MNTLAGHLLLCPAGTQSPGAAAAAVGSKEWAAAHRQTKYVPAPPLGGTEVLDLPEPTPDIEQAKMDLSTYGLCVIKDALSPELLQQLRDKLDYQAAAEAKAFGTERKGKNGIGSLVNKGKEFLQLVEHPVVDEMMGYLFGKHFLLSSLTGSYFNGPEEAPQALHRDQGYVPATADFPAACVMFWCLDDFTHENGGTQVIPGSHRWPAEALVKPPPRKGNCKSIIAPAGSCFLWDGRLWHGTGINQTGEKRRSVSTFFCLPWMRQQENWGVTTLQEVIDGASEKVKERLGLFSYGTLGTMSGGAPPENPKAQKKLSLGNAMVSIPDAVVGEGATLHPMRRVSRAFEGRA